MGSGWKGIAAGGLGLAAFEVVVVNRGAPERVGGIFETVANGIKRLLDPSVPALGPAPATTPTVTPAVATTPAPAPYPPANTLNLPNATKGPI